MSAVWDKRQLLKQWW